MSTSIVQRLGNWISSRSFPFYTINIYSKYITNMPTVGSELKNVTVIENSIVMSFEEKKFTSIDMSRDGYYPGSAEAMELNGPNELIFVWNE